MIDYVRGNEEFVKRIRDLMERSIRQQTLLITPFLSPTQIAIAKNVLGNKVLHYAYGGYEDAESCRLGICPYACDSDLDIVCLKSTYKNDGPALTHRDVLGALMHLGIDRNQFGDILVQEESIYIFVNVTQAHVVQYELTTISRYTCDFVVYTGQVRHQKALAWKAHSVSSMRLDCIVAACTNVSRTKGEALIRGKLVKVNHMPLEECKCLCNNNSTVSIRGFGRFEIRCDGRTSKKGKIMIEIGTYI